MRSNYYNYIYLDPTKPMEYKIKGLDIILKYEPFYVGKGTGKRLNDHKYGHSGKFMKSKLKSLKDKNIIPIILKINDNINEIEAYENEKFLIKSIGRRDLNKGTLVNLTDGGKENKGFKPSKRQINKTRIKNLGRKMKLIFSKG